MGTEIMTAADDDAAAQPATAAGRSPDAAGDPGHRRNAARTGDGGDPDDGELNAHGIDPDRLALCLDVLAEVEALPVEHPDAVAVRRATAGPFQTAQLQRRRDPREAGLGAAPGGTEATPTGAPGGGGGRTAGRPLRPPAPG